MELTPRRKVETALRGGCPGIIPFTVYDNHLPRCSAERELRNRGLCPVVRLPVFKTSRPRVRVTRETYREGEREFTRTYYSTPEGLITTLSEPAGFTTWQHEKMFKTPDDYRAIRAYLQDETYEPDYESFVKAQDRFGEDGIFRAGFGLEPLQSLISGMIFSMEDFCVQWMENRDEVLKLYDITVENRRRVYGMVACSPATHANYGGNVAAEIIGPERFRRYYLPHYEEAAEIMHQHGKLIGSHFDANCAGIADIIAESSLDFIEAFTPHPDTDMTLGQARRAWKDKVIWMNFPSSVHLASEEKIKRTTMDLLDEAGAPEGIIMGVTENVPEDRWQGNFSAIMTALEEHACRHPGIYGKKTDF